MCTKYLSLVHTLSVSLIFYVYVSFSVSALVSLDLKKRSQLKCVPFLVFSLKFGS